MPYDAPIKEMSFALDAMADIGRLESIDGLENYDPDLVEPILEEAGKLARDVLAPLNQSGDREGAKLGDDGVQAFAHKVLFSLAFLSSGRRMVMVRPWGSVVLRRRPWSLP